MENNIKLENLHIMLVEPSKTQYKLIVEQLHGLGVCKVSHSRDGATAGWNG